MTSLSPAEMTAIGGTAGVCEVLIMQVTKIPAANAKLLIGHIIQHILSRPCPPRHRKSIQWLRLVTALCSLLLRSRMHCKKDVQYRGIHGLCIEDWR